jgi:hypothetical protein
VKRSTDPVRYSDISVLAVNYLTVEVLSFHEKPVALFGHVVVFVQREDACLSFPNIVARSRALHS